MITWNEPTLNGNNGEFYLHIEGLSSRQVNEVYAHEVCRGSFVFPHPGTGKANPSMNSVLTNKYGALRCYWLLREDILDTTQQVALHQKWEDAITDALLTDTSAWLSKDDWENWLDQDGLSPYGTL